MFIFKYSICKPLKMNKLSVVVDIKISLGRI